MKNLLKIFFLITSMLVVENSCKKINDINTDPNNVTADNASPDYLMANVLIQTAMDYGNLGSGLLSGAMQHTYQDAFGEDYSWYQWNPEDWTGNYSQLRDNQLMMEKALQLNWKFHLAVGLIMRAFNFGMIADFWGDAPFSMALKGDQDGAQNQMPAFDRQEQIYDSVIADLKAAIPLLQFPSHPEITSATTASDVFYSGDTQHWIKVAYSLLLRYYLRLSSKRNVQVDVEAVAPFVFSSNDDDCAFSFPGTEAATSYQKASKYQGSSNFNRNKMCATLVKKLDALKDPRIVIMAEPIKIPSRVDANKFNPGDDSTLLLPLNGIRYINPAAAAKARYKQCDLSTYLIDRPYGALTSNIWSLYDTSTTYVGIPISYSDFDWNYNINGPGTQSASNSDYVSYLRRDIYDNPSGPLLNQLLISYYEICFDLSEAALNGWNVGGTAADWYNKGILASFDRWQVFTNYQSDVNGYAGCVKDYNSYITQSAVNFNGTLEQIMDQKWIASWQASNESFMDWRRTGYPTLTIGWKSKRAAIPIRFAYKNNEVDNNTENAQAAINNLEITPYVMINVEGRNSPWSKFWLLQGTGKPW